MDDKLKLLRDVLDAEPVPKAIEKVKEEKILRTPDIVDKAKVTLNEDQLNAFDGIVGFLKDPEKEMVTIIGYAGTGKTYLISKIISGVKGKVAMTAPTNKAVKVLADNKTDEMGGVIFSTIHKLLALKMKWVYPKGKQDFKPYQKLVSVWNKEPAINDYDILIVDEVSMLDDELFDMLVDIKKPRLKIIFLGDAAQIPPVGKLDAIPLLEEGRKEHGIGLFVLDKMMRQKEDSGILRTAHSIRENRFGFSDTIKERTSVHDTVFARRYNAIDEKKFMDKMLLSFSSEEFDHNPNYCKVIAWRNKTVNMFNDIIRASIYKTDKLEYIMPGEKLIADSPIIKNGNIVFSTSDEFSVDTYKEGIFNYSRPDNNSEHEERMQLEFDNMSSVHLDKSRRIYSIKYYKTMVLYNGIQYEIDIIHPDSVQHLGWAKSEVFKQKMFPEFEMLTDKFAAVKYNYAITCHKSQGSTYEKVFVIEDDIDINPNLIERNRIKYTAVSRASKELFILSKRN